MGRPDIPLNDFKDWLSQQDSFKSFNLKLEEPLSENIGKFVRAKVSEKKLAQRIDDHKGAEPEELIAELLEGGGTIVGDDGKYLVVQVESGTFQMPKFCLKIAD